MDAGSQAGTRCGERCIRSLYSGEEEPALPHHASSRRLVTLCLPPLLFTCGWTALASSGGGFTGLGDLPGGIVYSEANGVSANGSVVVGASRSASGTEAYFWIAGSGLVGLHDLPGGSFFSRGLAVSGDGLVVVGESASGNGTEAFVWSAAGGMSGLGDLDGAEFSSAAFGVSGNG